MKHALILILVMLIAGCAIPGPEKPERDIKHLLDYKLRREFAALGPLSNLGSFGGYFSGYYNSKQFKHERHAQFNWVIPPTTQKMWQEQAKTRSYMLGKYGHVLP